ncbi:MAG: T9SS type A sorting domain-containing protein [Saprospiraceae bacterium]|nr:T9SS type A sorting domain-containing protein [Saprospiraceae bacterium]
MSSPYKLIAADVNNNKSIAASDLTELRKLILGVNKEFATNSSWRFVDGSKKFADPNDPWLGGLSEVYAIDKLSNNMDINFIGIKVGDVNGNVVTNLNQNNTESRSSHTLQIKDRNVMRGEIVEIQVMADKAGMIYGLQTQLNSNGLIIRDIKGAAMSLELNNYVIPATNIARMSVTTPQGVRVTEGRVLFTIEAEVLKSGLLSEMLSINREFASELYTNNLEVESFNINWRKEDAAFALTSVTPNPWNVQTQISFELPQEGMVTFKVRDYTGKSIISTIDQYPAGQNVIQVNSSDLGQPGVYIYELRFGDKLISGKMILIE